MRAKAIGWALAAVLSGCDAGEEASGVDPDDPNCVRSRSLEIAGCPETLGESLCSEGTGHVPFGSALRYDSNPPHSGAHYPSATHWGVHEGTVDRGTYVHNLEHGGIVLAYNCTDCAQDIRAFADVVAERPDMRILVTRDVELPTRFAAISWSWVWTFETIDADAVMCFVDQHEGFAPENIVK